MHFSAGEKKVLHPPHNFVPGDVEKSNSFSSPAHILGCFGSTVWMWYTVCATHVNWQRRGCNFWSNDEVLKYMEGSLMKDLNISNLTAGFLHIPNFILRTIWVYWCLVVFNGILFPEKRNLNRLEEPVHSACVPSSSAIESLRKNAPMHEKLSREVHERKIKYLKEQHEMRMRILQVKLDMKLEESTMIKKKKRYRDKCQP